MIWSDMVKSMLNMVCAQHTDLRPLCISNKPVLGRADLKDEAQYSPCIKCEA